MNRKEFIKQVGIDFKWLIDLGYNFSTIERSVYFRKISNHNEFSLSFYWAEYNDFLIMGVSCCKLFPDVERIIKKHTGNYNDTIGKTMNMDIPNKFIPIINNGEFEWNTFSITDYSQIALFSDAVKLFYEKEVLSFFEEFKTVEDIMNWMSKTDMEEHSDLLVSSNNSMMLRKLIIMKKCNDDGFDNLYQEYRDYLKEQSDNNQTPFVAMFEEFKKFDEYFTSDKLT